MEFAIICLAAAVIISLVLVIYLLLRVSNLEEDFRKHREFVNNQFRVLMDFHKNNLEMIDVLRKEILATAGLAAPEAVEEKGLEPGRGRQRIEAEFISIIYNNPTFRRYKPRVSSIHFTDQRLRRIYEAILMGCGPALMEDRILFDEVISLDLGPNMDEAIYRQYAKKIIRWRPVFPSERGGSPL